MSKPKKFAPGVVVLLIGSENPELRYMVGQVHTLGYRFTGPVNWAGRNVLAFVDGWRMDPELMHGTLPVVWSEHNMIPINDPDADTSEPDELSTPTPEKELIHE